MRAAATQLDLGFQGVEAEVADFPGPYRRPNGRVLLGMVDAGDGMMRVGGTVMVKPLDDGRPGRACEMKRLFVAPDARRHGLGDVLVRDIVDQARQLGYERMLLDTCDYMTGARALYTRHGFAERPAYYHNPLGEQHSHLRIVFYERSLAEDAE